MRRPSVQMAEPRPPTIVCDVGGLAVDATTVDALARLQLAARRLGHDVLVSGAPGELVELLELCGLRDVLRVEVRGQPEEREERLGVEEHREPLDRPAP
jgi:ABC-type transporter Mla MlaB component